MPTDKCLLVRLHVSMCREFVFVGEIRYFINETLLILFVMVMTDWKE